MEHIPLIYYIQTNVICMLLISYVYVAYARQKSIENIVFSRLAASTFFYCLADILTWAFNGSTLPGARVLLYIGNILYIAAPCVLSVMWSRYVGLRLYGLAYRRSRPGLVLDILMYLMMLLTLLTPWTGFGFTLDAGNVYHRGPGAYLVPLSCWAYLVYISVRVIRFIRHAPALEAAGHKSLLLFNIPPLVGNGLQLIFYGITTTQVGFTLGALILFFARHHSQISRDALTGLNNRHEYDQYVARLQEGTGNVLVCMIDVDRFKQINDKFGHQQGDVVLCRVAGLLLSACNHLNGRLFIARYGGDEFVILGRDCTGDTLDALRQSLLDEVAACNREGGLPCEVSISFGMALGSVTDDASFRHLLETADKQMYHGKERLR